MDGETILVVQGAEKFPRLGGAKSRGHLKVASPGCQARGHESSISEMPTYVSPLPNPLIFHKKLKIKKNPWFCQPIGFSCVIQVQSLLVRSIFARRSFPQIRR